MQLLIVVSLEYPGPDKNTEMNLNSDFNAPSSYSKEYPGPLDNKSMFGDQTNSMFAMQQMFTKQMMQAPEELIKDPKGKEAMEHMMKKSHGFKGNPIANPMMMGNPMAKGNPMGMQANPMMKQQLQGVSGEQKQMMMMNAIEMQLMSNIHESINLGMPPQQIDQLLQQNPHMANQEGFNGMRPLHKAILKRNPAILDVLLKHNADVNLGNDHGETPLHFACKLGNIITVEKLLNCGADITALDQGGRGVVHHAAQGGSVLSLHYLTTVRGLDLRVVDKNMITPLHLGSAHGQDEVLDYLLKKDRCDVHACDMHGNTAMHIAAQYGQASLVWTLMLKGGIQMIHENNNDHLTPIKLALQGDSDKNKQVIDVLNVYAVSGQKTGPVQGPTPVWWGLLLAPMAVFHLSALVAGCFEYSGWPMFVFVLMQGYFIYQQIHRMNHVSRWPNPIQAGMFGGGLINTAAMYFYVLLPKLHEEMPLLSFGGIIGCLVCLFLYYRIMTRDPGICQTSARKEESGTQYTVRDIASGEIRLQALCVTCEIIPPRRSRHCRLCEHCYLDCDHHCLFMYRCIARYNHRAFLIFILVCIISMLFFVYFTVYVCSLESPGTTLSYAVLVGFHSHPALLALTLINLLSSLWLTTLLGTQIKMVSKAHTTCYQPNDGTTELTHMQRAKNVVYFMAGRRPYAVDSGVAVFSA